MNRRDALERVALILGGTVIGGAAFLQGCKNPSEKAAAFSLSQDQIAFLDEVAETIIPTTNTPGAKASRSEINPRSRHARPTQCAYLAVAA